MKTHPDPCLGLSLRRADRVVSQIYNRHLSPMGLRGTQFAVLRVIAENDCITARELSRYLIMDQTTASRALRPLLRDELIEARPAPHDRREKLLCLTAAGKRFYRKAEKAWLAAQDELRERLGSEGCDALLGVTRRVAEIPR